MTLQTNIEMSQECASVISSLRCIVFSIMANNVIFSLLNETRCLTFKLNVLIHTALPNINNNKRTKAFDW